MRTSTVGRGLLIYDGDCGFCTRTARWITKRLPRGYRVEASQRIDDLDGLGLSRRDVHEAAYWIDADGRTHRGHLAIARALENAGGIYPPIGAMMRVWPIEPLAAWVYEVVARNRHHLPGGTNACRL